MSQLFSNRKVEKSISAEEIQQIVEAIQEHKYSWACVLMLRCAGYNPLQYIPYRTYSRILKQNELGEGMKEEFANPSQTVGECLPIAAAQHRFRCL